MSLLMWTRVLFFAVVTTFVAASTYGFYLERGFATYPRSPETVSNRVVPHQWKGTTIYVTNDEDKALRIDDIIIFGSLFVGAGLVIVLRKSRKM